MAVFMILPAWFILMMPQLIAGLGKLVASRVALNKQNRYNSPIEQMRRIREAGLPFAAFEAGQAGSQSQLPDLSGFDQIGGAIGTGITQSNQIKMFEELLRRAGADADVSENLRDLSDSERDAMLNNSVDMYGKPIPLAGAKKVLEFNILKFGAWSAEHKERVDDINRKVLESRFDSGQLQKIADEEFERLVNSNKQMIQAWETNDKQNAAFQKIIDTMQGSDGKLGFMEALLIEFLKAIGGGFKSDSKGTSGNIGF